MEKGKKGKVKYDPEYISFVENGESAAVFIARDVVKDVDTRGMWIDITDLRGDRVTVPGNRRGARRRKDLLRDMADRRDRVDRWDFKYFDLELFTRKTQPQYPEGASEDERKYITWKTAHKDIVAQRTRGHKGPRYRVCPRLVNRSKGRGKPKWDYEIVSVKRLK